MRKILVSIMIVLLLGAGAYWFFTTSAPTYRDEDAVSKSVSGALDKLTPLRVPPPGFKDYTNKNYSFSLFYPENLQVKEYKEQGGAATISFQNVETLQGFQIFVVPYEQNEITEARFKQDVPSGVRKNESNITLDGAEGAAFQSEDVALGETYEVWVLHYPFLFEITTLKGQEQFLQSILQTWKFL